MADLLAGYWGGRRDAHLQQLLTSSCAYFRYRTDCHPALWLRRGRVGACSGASIRPCDGDATTPTSTTAAVCSCAVRASASNDTGADAPCTERGLGLRAARDPEHGALSE